MRNSKGQFVKGSVKTENWYKAMAKRTGKNHSMWNPELHKVEMVKCQCGCGELMNKYGANGKERKYIKDHYARVLGRSKKGAKLSEETKQKISDKKRGVKRKKEGEYKRSYDYNERRRFRREMQMTIFERDNFTCQICGQVGGKLQVDHIQGWAEYPELRFSPDNCRTVCMACHYYLTFKKQIPKDVVWGHNFSKSHNNI